MSTICSAIFWGDFAEAKRMVNEDPKYVQIEYGDKWSVLDVAIAYGRLEIAKLLWENGGRPNLDACRDGIYTPVHEAAYGGHNTTLKWVFAKKILPLSVLKIKSGLKKTPLDWAILMRRKETAALFRRLLYVDPVFLAMHCAKRDHKCVLRRLPDELLDMVVAEVAARVDLILLW